MALGFAAAPASAVHDQQDKNCGMGGATEVTDPVHADQVDDGEIDQWTVTVPEGQQGALIVQPLNGDIDVYVCVGKGNHVCEDHNAAGFADGCGLEELSAGEDIPNAPNYGPPLEGGKTYRIDVQHCFSSQDVPDSGQAGGCDYGAVFVPGGAGTLDPLPAIQYLLFFSTDL